MAFNRHLLWGGIVVLLSQVIYINWNFDGIDTSTGNSCRSQMAHGFLQSFDQSIEVYSGGTQPVSQVNPIAVEVMKEGGIDISHHTPTHVNTYLNQDGIM
jgi:hypothetical protein